LTLTTSEREELIRKYEDGPRVLNAALAAVPEEAMRFRPTPQDWSVHEIVLHCGDSETMASSRIRMVAAEPEPLIVGYDQEQWAVRFDYHALPLEAALTVIAATRANTVALLRTLPDGAWERAGKHTESGSYSAEDWLRIYSAHLHDHADQIAANVAAWQGAEGA
jgi:hypothetical protein